MMRVIPNILAATALLGCLALNAGMTARAAVLEAPGSCTVNCGGTSTPDVMLLHFDENGVGTIAENGGPTMPLIGMLAADPSTGGGGGGVPVLTYMLPEPVISGDAAFAEPGDGTCSTATASNCSDWLRFTDNTGAINGGVTGAGSRMIFYSDRARASPRIWPTPDFPPISAPATPLFGRRAKSARIAATGSTICRAASASTILSTMSMSASATCRRLTPRPEVPQSPFSLACWLWSVNAAGGGHRN